MAKVEKHVHRLKRHTYKSGNSIYFCTLSDCLFKVDVALAFGKTALCNLCNKEFTMNEYQCKLNRPHCDGCSKKKIKGADGKNHFVRPTTLPVLSTVANENNEDLRSRLNSVVSPTVDEDI